MNIFKNKTVLAGIAGTVIGLIIAFVPNTWNIIEPVTGIATLTIAAYVAWENQQIQKRLSENAMEQKKFEITFGLQKGYTAEGGVLTIEQARGFVKEWIEIQITNQQPFLTGMLDSMHLVYPVRNGESGKRVIEEPGAIYSGSLSPNYDKGRNDQEVVETLNSLARFIGQRMEQKRVYLSYCGKQWTIDINVVG